MNKTAAVEKESAPATPEQPHAECPKPLDEGKVKHGGNMPEADAAHYKVVGESPAQDPTSVGVASSRRRRKDPPTRLPSGKYDSSQKVRMAKREYGPSRNVIWNTEIIPANSLGRPPEKSQVRIPLDGIRIPPDGVRILPDGVRVPQPDGGSPGPLDPREPPPNKLSGSRRPS